MKTLKIENARLIFKNFAGKAGKYNREGDKNFSVIIDAETASMLAQDGWNVKQLRSREDGEPGDYYLPVACSYKIAPPKVVMISGKTKTNLDEDTVSELDYADVEFADLIINPYHYNVNGKEGVKAYLKTAYITISTDEFASKYEWEEEEELPF